MRERETNPVKIDRIWVKNGIVSQPVSCVHRRLMGDDVSVGVSAGPTCQREKERGKSGCGGLGRSWAAVRCARVKSRRWTGSGWPASLFFFCQNIFSFFFSLVLKLKIKPVQNFLEKIVKILFRELIQNTI